MNSHQYFHWLYHHRNRGYFFIIGSGAFFWLFMIMTQPFGIYESNLTYLVLSVVLLPISLFWMMLVYFIDLASKKMIVGNHAADFWFWVLKLVLMIHAVLLVRGYLCNWQCIDHFEYLQLWLAYLLMFLLCYVPFTLYGRFLYYQNMLAGQKPREGHLMIKGSGKENIAFDPNDVIYFQSDDNYVDTFLKDGQKESLRTTLGALAEQLHAYAQFIRIHRSYVINTTFYGSYSKSSNTIRLYFEDQTIELPVSRKYKAEVENLFTHPK